MNPTPETARPDASDRFADFEDDPPMPPVQPTSSRTPPSPPPPDDDDDDDPMTKLFAGYTPPVTGTLTPEEEEKRRMDEERDRLEIEAEERALNSVEAREKDHKVYRGVTRYQVEANPATSILGDGWLRKGDLATLISPAGVGKSVAAIQAAMAWGLGLPYLGIRPPRPLDILLFLGEDDEETIRECMDGLLDHSEAVTGRKLTFDDLQPLEQRLRISFERRFTGGSFFPEMRAILDIAPADLLIINPLLAYLGGDVVTAASGWLRDDLLPSFKYRGCAGLVVHHTVKLPKGGWESLDNTYSAIGGAELANIPRSILTLHPTDADGLHVVSVSKRKTTGWKDSDGNDTDRYFIKRTDNPRRPAWLPVGSDDAARLIEAAIKGGGRGRR